MFSDSACRSVALVVEDEPLIAMEAVDLLTDGGFKVLEAWSGDQALRMLEEKGPVGLLFTDVHMPGSMNGFALAREVVKRWPDTAIVICSGHLKPDGNAMPPGARFINKPFTSGLVLETIRELTGDP